MRFNPDFEPWIPHVTIGDLPPENITINHDEEPYTDGPISRISHQLNDEDNMVVMTSPKSQTEVTACDFEKVFVSRCSPILLKDGSGIWYSVPWKLAQSLEVRTRLPTLRAKLAYDSRECASFGNTLRRVRQV
jgi:hypothetical protein